MDNFNSFLEGSEGWLDIRMGGNFIWSLRWWIIGCVALSLGITYLYIESQTPMYNSSVTAIFIDSNSLGNESTVVAEITGRNLNGGPVNNEKIVLRSPSLMTRVVRKMDLNYRSYRCESPVFNSLIMKIMPDLHRSLCTKRLEYYQDSPFSMELLFDPYYSRSMRPNQIILDFEHISEGRYSLLYSSAGGDARNYEYGSRLYQYGDTLAFNGVKAVIRLNPGQSMEEGGIYRARYDTAESMGTSLCRNVSIVGGDPFGFSKDAITISYVDVDPRRAADILSTLVDEYNADAREFKGKSIVHSIAFINERLKEVAAELGSVEYDYKNYQASHDFIEGESETESGADVGQQLLDLRLQKTFLEMIKEETKSGSIYSIIPSNVGNIDAGLNQTIVEYNSLVSERERMLLNSSVSHPSVQSFDNCLVSARQGVLNVIANLEKVYSVRESELTAIEEDVRERRSAIPGLQMDLASISRKQQIIEPLYMELHRKREELQLSMFSIPDKVRIMESPSFNGTPISPDSRKAYLAALIIAILLPIVVMLVRNLMRTKVESKKDVKKMTRRPVLATIPLSLGSSKLFDNDNRNPFSESIRMLRSSLKFLSGNVIQVTSSISGEGKSFISSNLALSLSFINSRVALIGLDLRKPALRKVFSMMEFSNENSVVNYLIGGCQDISSIPVSLRTGSGCLDIFFSGPIPPNPTDLLSQTRVRKLIDYCREHYDYVICDTPPFLLVADSTIINEYMDYSLYIVRSEYTEFKMLLELNEHMAEGHLKNVNFVLNGVDTSASKYRYGYESGYSYGYGSYGYVQSRSHSHKHKATKQFVRQAVKNSESSLKRLRGKFGESVHTTLHGLFGTSAFKKLRGLIRKLEKKTTDSSRDN